MNNIHIPSPCRLTNTQCNFKWVSKSRVTPDFYHSTLSLCDNNDCVFSLSGNRTFRPTLRVSYVYTEILDISTGLLHPHRNFGCLHGSLTPTQKFWDISSGLLHPHRNSGYLPRSLTPTEDLSDIIAGLLHRNSRLFHLRRLTAPFLLCPTHINYSSFPDLNYESSLDVVPKTNLTHTDHTVHPHPTRRDVTVHPHPTR